MIILAIIKASGLKTAEGSFALVWEVFWQQIEASVAVIMVSFTAFRSAFVSNSKVTPRRSDSLTKRLLRYFQRQFASAQDYDSPSGELEWGAPLTLGTKFRHAQKMGLGESCFSEEAEMRRLESVHVQPAKMDATYHGDYQFVSNNEMGPPSSRSSLHPLWNKRSENTA